MVTMYNTWLRIALSGILLGALGGTSCSGQQAPVPLDSPMLEAVIASYAEPESFGIYLMGNKVGWMDLGIRREGSNLRISSSMALEIVSMDQKVSVTQSDSRVFELNPPWRLVSADFSSSQNNERTVGAIVRGADGWFRSTTGKSPVKVDMSSCNLPGELLMDIMARSNSVPGASNEYSSVDLTDGRPLKTVVTLKSAGTQKVGGVDVPLLVWNQQSAGIDMEVFTDSQGHLIKGYMGGIMEIRKEDAASAHNPSVSLDLFQQSVLKVDRPIGTQKTKTRISLGFPASAPGTIPSLPGQEVSQKGTGSTLVLTVPRPPRKASADEVVVALKPESRFPADEARLRDLALTAVGETSPADKASNRIRVTRLLAFVANYIDDALIPDSMAMDDLLARRRGDCSEHSRLFVTLARALDIPAREITGFYYMGDNLKAWGAHAWAEVLLDGSWHMVDPVMNQLDIDVFHIATGTGTGGMFESLGMFRGITAQVLSSE